MVSLSAGGPERDVSSRLNGRPNGGPLLEAVAAGAMDGHPAEILSSKALADVLFEIREAADVVLVDVPPLLEAPDAAALISRMDAVLLVVSSADARGPTLADARRATDTWNPAILGRANRGQGGTAVRFPVSSSSGIPHHLGLGARPDRMSTPTSAGRIRRLAAVARGRGKRFRIEASDPRTEGFHAGDAEPPAWVARSAHAHAGGLIRADAGIRGRRGALQVSSRPNGPGHPRSRGLALRGHAPRMDSACTAVRPLRSR